MLLSGLSRLRQHRFPCLSVVSFITIITLLSVLRRSFGLASSSSSSSFSSSSSSISSIMKRAKLDPSARSSKVIGTHSGTFQADEAMGCWMLQQLPAYRNSKIVRSRDPKTLEDLDIVIDVGGVYDHGKLRYDHHQRGFDERFEPREKDGEKEIRCTKLSASGLVYRHYGKELIKTYYPEISDTDLDLAYTRIYDSLLEALDAIDTGVEMVPDGMEAIYKDTTGLSMRVKRLNPRWNEEVDETTGKTPVPDERFALAKEECGKDFLSVMISVVESEIPARAFVEKAVLERHEKDISGEVIVLESGGLPWSRHLFDLEKEHKIDPLIKYVLYTDQAGMWRIQCVGVEGQAFTNRLSLPEAWRGVRDENLEKVTGIAGSSFCHAAGFIGGGKTYECVLEMARVSLKQQETTK